MHKPTWDTVGGAWLKMVGESCLKVLSLLVFLLFLSVPDRQYEVRVWGFNRQKDGEAAVWKGRTDKIYSRRKTLLFRNE